VIPDYLFIGLVVGALLGVATAVVMDSQGRRGGWLSGFVVAVVFVLLWVVLFR
jgi:uncharacterized membrane-anchored protein